ncbi:MAG: hypothetical protein RL038_1311 [Actinomycetota bacterium]|jgi:hypothetical protein
MAVQLPIEIQKWLEQSIPDRAIEKAAVKVVLAKIAEAAPGKSVELRIPPHAAIQIVEGTNHRRGTPGAVVEMSATALIHLAIGDESWSDLVAEGKLLASGERSDLSHLFPIWNL